MFTVVADEGAVEFSADEPTGGATTAAFEGWDGTGGVASAGTDAGFCTTTAGASRPWITTCAVLPPRVGSGLSNRGTITAAATHSTTAPISR